MSLTMADMSGPRAKVGMKLSWRCKLGNVPLWILPGKGKLEFSVMDLD